MKACTYIPVCLRFPATFRTLEFLMSSPVLDRSHADAPDRPLRTRTRPFALPEVRWASAATVLFLLGLAAQFGGAPAWTWWALYLACYVTGGWEPALAGLRALREKSLD